MRLLEQNKGIIVGFTSMVLLIATITFVGLNQVSLIQKNLDKVVSEHLEKIQHSTQMRSAARERTLIMQKILFTEDPFERDELVMEFHGYAREFIEARSKLVALSHSDEEKILINEQSQLTNIVVPIQNKIIDLAFEEKDQQAITLLNEEAIEGQNNVFNVLDKIYLYQRTMADETAAAVIENKQQSEIIMTAASFAVIFLAIGIAIVITRREANYRLELNNKNLELEERVQDRTYKLEQALKDAKQAAEAKADFLANMSHEIRTPMNGVLGMLSLLRDSNLNEQQKEFAETAYVSGETMMNVLNDILDFSKISAGKLALESLDFNIVDTIENITSLIATTAHEKNLELIINLSPDFPKMVIGDPTRLSQILTNLLGNAVKFTDEGEIVISASHQYLDKDDIEISIEVKDTGIGISSKNLQHIFNSFSQADSSTTRQFGGTGLGLAISSHLVQLMDGTLEVESEEGQGSRFYFTIHMKKSHTSLPELFPTENLNNLKTLVVDDNATNRDILNTLLSRWGLKTTEAVDALAGLVKLKESLQHGMNYDLIITDMMMPEMDGIQFSNILSKDPVLSQIPIIILSSAASDIQLADEQNNISAVISKPVRQSLLYNTIVTSLEKKMKVNKNTVQNITSRSEQILVVEDNKVNQIVAIEILKALGFSPDLAVNGQEALDKIQQKDYQLIFMDCQMPILDGFKTTEAIRGSDQYTDTIIIAMTANAMEGDRENCLEAGMNDYLAKPLHKETMAAVIHQWLPV